MANLALKIVLTSIRSRPPPHPIERILICSENNTLGDLHEAIYNNMHLMENHAFAFYFSNKPFGSLEEEYGSPKETVLNPAEYRSRNIHFRLTQKIDSLTKTLSEPESGQEPKQEVNPEYFNSIIHSPDKEELPDIKSAFTKTLESLHLKIGKRFFYIFDFGDLWTFTIEVIEYTTEVSLVKNQPFVVESIGDPVPQYEDISIQEFMFQEKHALYTMQRRRDIHKQIRQQQQQQQQLKAQEPLKNKPRYEFRFYRTFTPGSNILFINIKDIQKKKIFTLSFLIDLFKLGLKDFSMYNESARSLIRRINARDDVEFEEILKADAANLLARGLAIAKEVGTTISVDCQKWLENLGIPKIILTGSLYKCFLCEKGELPEETVKKILEIAKRELQSGVAGTEEEEMIFFVCDSCTSKKY